MLMFRRRPEAGFTLIELLITITVASLLAALAVPTFTMWFRDSRIRTTAEALQNDLRLAQQKAISEGRQVTLVLTNANPAGGVAAAPVAPGTAASYWFVEQVPNQFNPLPVYVSGSTGTVTGTQITATNTSTGAGIAAVCFNSSGRQVANNNTNANMPVPTACSVGDTQFTITYPNADRPLQVRLGMGGSVRMCDPAFTVAQQPFGC